MTYMYLSVRSFSFEEGTENEFWQAQNAHGLHQTSGVIKVQYYISDLNLGGTLAIEVGTYNGNVVVIMILL